MDTLSESSAHCDPTYFQYTSPTSSYALTPPSTV